MITLKCDFPLDIFLYLILDMCCLSGQKNLIASDIKILSFCSKLNAIEKRMRMNLVKKENFHKRGTFLETFINILKPFQVNYIFVKLIYAINRQRLHAIAYFKAFYN